MSWIALVYSVCSIFGEPALPGQIEEVSREFGVDRTLILSIVFQESSCRATAQGSSGDTGLMQIIPRWHQDRIDHLGVTDLFDPLDNMRVGASLLSHLGVNLNPTEALVMYNGGYAKPPSSYIYAKKVLARKAQYDEQLRRRE
jgi:soluble lytic murein transglycosylase-like protein